MAASAGLEQAQYNLGVMYQKGQGVSRTTRPPLLVHLAAEQGYAAAQYNLGWLYAKGQGMPTPTCSRPCTGSARRPTRATRRAAQPRHDVRHRQGRAAGQVSAIEWYRRAAEQGYPRAQFNLALRYDGGQGVPRDVGRPCHWFRKAAEQGYAPAQFNLGAALRQGPGPAQDSEKAILWYGRAGEQGHASSQFNLA
jgi:TPR repeat protein